MLNRTGRIAVVMAFLMTSLAVVSPSQQHARTVAQDASVVSVSAIDLAFEPSTITVAQGQAIRLTNNGVLKHNLIIEGLNDQDQASVSQGIGSGTTADLIIPFELAPGTYTFYCGVPGHKAAGMVGTVTVVAGDPALVAATPVTEGATPVAPQAGTPIASNTSAQVGLAHVQPANLLDILPAGEAGTVSVISQSSIYNNTVVAMVRNNTGQQVAAVSITGSIRDAAGNLSAVGSALRTYPTVIDPGSVAVAYVTFQGVAPNGSNGELLVASGPTPSYISESDLAITDASVVGGQLIGFATNTGADTAYSGVVTVVCVDESDAISTWSNGKLGDTTIDPGATTTFAINPIPTGCDRQVVVGGGD